MNLESDYFLLCWHVVSHDKKKGPFDYRVEPIPWTKMSDQAARRTSSKLLSFEAIYLPFIFSRSANESSNRFLFPTPSNLNHPHHNKSWNLLWWRWRELHPRPELLYQIKSSDDSVFISYPVSNVKLFQHVYSLFPGKPRYSCSCKRT